MAYVVTEACIKYKHADCLTVFLLDQKKPSSEDADEWAKFKVKRALLELA